MKKNLPVYELKINIEEDAIVSAIALVDEPAIESNFLAFAKQSLQFIDDTKMELLGAAMIPNQLIYRIDKQTGQEFNVFFSVDTIRQIAQQYFRFGFQNSTNINHTYIPANSYIYQSYIVDSTKGIKAPTGVDVPDGTWIVGMKVDDAGTWNKIKAGKINGFSIEGMFDFIQTNLSKQNEDEKLILDLLNQINKIINKKI